MNKVIPAPHSTDFGGLEPGTNIKEYRLDKVIGIGGMATVYRAIHKPSGRAVALKVLNVERLVDDEASARFEQEAYLLSKINHPNILEIYSVGRLADRRCYFAMELLNGMNLHARIQQGGPLKLNEAMAVLVAVSSALEAIHHQGIIHRDVKPSNIFLVCDTPSTFSSIKLLDLGIAKSIGELPAMVETKTHQLTGSLHYMSPEQCRGQALDLRSDIYSLGLVVYEMLTGQRAASAHTIGEVLLEQQTRRISLLSHETFHFSSDLDNALQRALAKDPAERYNSMREMTSCMLKAAKIADSQLPKLLCVPAFEKTPGPKMAQQSELRHANFHHTQTMIRSKQPRTKTKLRKHALARYLLIALVLSAVLGFVLWSQYKPKTPAMMAPQQNPLPRTPTLKNAAVQHAEGKQKSTHMVAPSSAHNGDVHFSHPKAEAGAFKDSHPTNRHSKRSHFPKKLLRKKAKNQRARKARKPPYAIEDLPIPF